MRSMFSSLQGMLALFEYNHMLLHGFVPFVCLKFVNFFVFLSRQLPEGIRDTGLERQKTCSRERSHIGYIVGLYGGTGVCQKERKIHPNHMYVCPPVSGAAIPESRPPG